MIYHNIQEDFPDSDKKKLMKLAYFCWFLNNFCCAWNMICLFMTIFVPQLSAVESVVSDFVGSLIFCVLWIPLSFILWYRTLYKAVKQSKSSLFILFFYYFHRSNFTLYIGCYRIMVKCSSWHSEYD